MPFFAAFDDGRYVVGTAASVEALFSLACTGTPIGVDPVNWLILTRPDGSTKLQVHGEVHVVVAELAGFCEDPFAVPAYVGIARLVVDDSDVDLSGSGADAAQVQLVGMVSGESGQRYHLVAFFQTVVGPEFTSPEDFVFRHLNAKIKLTPIGR